MFEKLGIDRTKEIEISHFGELENSLHYYSGWFHVVGEFIGKDCYVPQNLGGSTIELIKVIDDFGIGFSRRDTLSIFKTDKEIFQVEFECKIPWKI